MNNGKLYNSVTNSSNTSEVLVLIVTTSTTVLVMWPESGIWCELPLTSFNVTHPGLPLMPAVSVDMF